VVAAATMKAKYYNTLLALAVLAAMWGALTYWDKRKAHEPPKTTAQEKILALESSHIQSITLKPREGEAVTCRREGGKWVIVEPRQLPADQSSVSALLDSLTGATIDEVVQTKPTDLKDFGLDQPAETVEASTDTKPQSFTLLLGGAAPAGGNMYAQVAGNPRVVTLASYLKSSLEKSLFDLRDKRAVTLDTGRLQRIEVEAKGKRWTLAKNPEGAWDLVLPPPVRADRFTVESMLDRLRDASMQSVVTEDKRNTGRYGFGAPALRLELSAPGASQTLLVGKKDDGHYYAMNSALEPVFTLDTSFVSQLEKDPADLRDRALFSFSTYEAKRLEVDTGSLRRVFEQQKDHKWKQTAPSPKDVAKDKLETLLDDLLDLRATSFPKGENLASFGLKNPAYSFTVQFGEKNEKETVEVSKVGEHVYARRSTDALASEVPKSALDGIEKALKDL
jgi:hypothetical protein